MGLPGILFFLIFCYLPMGGIVVAFQNYQPWLGIFKSPWVGFEWFKQFFTLPQTLTYLKNTILVNGAKFIIGFPITIIFAILLSELIHKPFKKVVQTISYFPYFLSWAAIYGLMFSLLNPTYGLVNNLIAFFGGQKINFLISTKWFIPLVAISSLWKYLGWGTIIYLAAISGLNTELYEAANIDGANRFQRIWHVTLPGMLPTITILLVLQIGSLMNSDFTQLQAMLGSGNGTKAILYPVGQVIDTWAYMTGIQGGQISFAAAGSLFKNVIVVILMLGTNWIVKKSGQEGLI